MNRDDLERLLTELGRSPVEPPDEITATRIERNWRRSTSVPSARRRSRSVAAGGAAVLLAAAASVSVVVVSRSTERVQPVVAAARDITVELPDGESLSAQGGEALPEGAIVLGGPGASGVIGGVFVGPRSEYVVRDGRLERSGSSSGPDTSAVSPDSTINQPGPQPTTPSTTPTTPARSTPNGPPATNSTGRPRPTPQRRLTVNAALQSGATTISWAAPTGSSVVRYVVVRTKKWNGRTLPAGRRIAVIRAGRPLVAVDPKPVRGTFYVIAAYGPRNRLLALGSVAAPA